MSNVETVGAMYEAFGRGDIPAILDCLTDDVRWDVWDEASDALDGTIPYLVPRKGKGEVAEFFGSLAGVEFHGFQPLTIAGAGDTVLASIALDATIKATGKRFQDFEIHVWTFRPDGKVTSLRHVIDTRKHYEANTP
jgi:ketosteroid isomerase-like protein